MLRYHLRDELIPIAKEFYATAQRRKQRESEIEALNTLGNAHRILGRRAKRLRILRKPMALVRAMRDRKRQRQIEAIVMYNLGVCYAELGALDRAIGLYEQSLVIERELGNWARRDRQSR